MSKSSSNSDEKPAQGLETLQEQTSESFPPQCESPLSVFSLFPAIVFELGRLPPVAKAHSSWKPPPPDSHRPSHGRIRHHHVGPSSAQAIPPCGANALAPMSPLSPSVAALLRYNSFTHNPYGAEAHGSQVSTFTPEPGILPLPSSEGSTVSGTASSFYVPNVSSFAPTVLNVSIGETAFTWPDRRDQRSSLVRCSHTLFGSDSAVEMFPPTGPQARSLLEQASPHSMVVQPSSLSRTSLDDRKPVGVAATGVTQKRPSLAVSTADNVQPDLSLGFETIQASSQRLHHMISRVADPPERSHPSWQPPTPNQLTPQPGVQSHTSIAPAQPLPPPQFVAHQAPFFSESVDPSAYFHNLSRPDQNCVTPIDPSLPLNPHVSDTMRFPSFFSFIPQPGVLPYPDVGTNSVSSQDVNIPLGTKLSFSQLQGQHIHPPRNLAAGCPYKHASPESRRESSDDALSLDTAAMPTIRQGVKQDSRSEKSLRRRVKKPDSNDTATSSSSLSPLPLPPFRDPSLTLENASGGGLRASPAQSHTPAQRVLQRPSHLQHHTQLKQQPNKFRSGGPRQT